MIDSKSGVMRITTLDERFYAVPGEDPKTKLPIYEYYPSASWIAGYYPKGKGFEQYLKDNGGDTDMMLIEASERGSHVHKAVEMIILGETLDADTRVYNGQTGFEEELTTEEWEMIKSFVDWNEINKPVYLLSERTVLSKKYKFGGTLDIVAKIGDSSYLIDLKTSKNIYPSHRIQISSYKHALMEENPNAKNLKLAVLQLGYKANKPKKDGTRTMFKFTEIEDQFKLFLYVYAIWKNENPNAKPRQIDLPMKLSIPNPLVEEKVEKKKKTTKKVVTGGNVKSKKLKK